MDYYISKRENDYYLPIFGSREVPSGQYNVIQEDSFTTVGTSQWTCPEGVTKIRIILSGGGGGGGGGFDFYHQSGGQSGKNGTNGQLLERVITVVPNTTYSITVGAGGTAGRTTHSSTGAYGSGVDGGNGGSSSFDSYTADGGVGGLAGSGGNDGGDSD